MSQHRVRTSRWTVVCYYGLVLRLSSWDFPPVSPWFRPCNSDDVLSVTFVFSHFWHIFFYLPINSAYPYHYAYCTHLWQSTMYSVRKSAPSFCLVLVKVFLRSFVDSPLAAAFPTFAVSYQINMLLTSSSSMPPSPHVSDHDSACTNIYRTINISPASLLRTWCQFLQINIRDIQFCSAKFASGCMRKFPTRRAYVRSHVTTGAVLVLTQSRKRHSCNWINFCILSKLHADHKFVIYMYINSLSEEFLR